MAGQHLNKQGIENMIYMKAQKDDDFRQKLLSDPRSTIENELGVKLPDGLNIHVNENTASDIYLSIPSSGKGELSEAELSGVSGGWTPCTCTNCGEYTSFNPDCTPDC